MTTAPPLIGVSSDIRRARGWGEGIFAGLPYVQAVARAGGMPLVIPATTDRAALATVLERLDGLVLIGGRDIHPNLYGQKIHDQTRLADRRGIAPSATVAVTKYTVPTAPDGDIPRSTSRWAKWFRSPCMRGFPARHRIHSTLSASKIGTPSTTSGVSTGSEVGTPRS